MKCILLITFSMLLAFLSQAQTPVTITGQITKISDGSPVANWYVSAYAGNTMSWDSTQFAFSTAITDNDGNYALTITVPAGYDSLTLGIDNGCFNDPVLLPYQELRLPADPAGLVQNFSVCGDQPVFPDCSVFPWYEPTPDSLTLLFHADLFAIDSPTVATYAWDFGDGGTSTAANPIHTYAAQGEYWVTVTVITANGCLATANMLVWIGNQPPFSPCRSWIELDQVDSVTFNFVAGLETLDSSTAVSYLWDFGDGTTSTEANPQHTYAQPGFYVITLTVVTSSGCETVTPFFLDTTFPPAPDCFTFFTYVQSDTTTFAFHSETWSVFGDSANVLSYQWDFGDGTTSTEADPVHTYADQGMYTVQLTVLTEDSCTAYACDIVLALDCPVDTFWYGCQAMFATGFGFDPNGNPLGDTLTVSFWDMSLGAVVSWAWDFGDGATDSVQNPVHTYAAEGIYLVTLTIVTVDGCESTVAFQIFVGEDFPWIPEPDCQAMFVPMPDSLGGTGIQFIDWSFSPGPIQTWAWDFGDGSTSSEQNPYHVYSQPGIYSVSLTITADSCNSVITFEIDTDNPWSFTDAVATLGAAGQTSGTVETPLFSGVKLFPNPAADEFQVAFSSDKALDYDLRLTDLSGRLLLTRSARAAAGTNSVRVEAGNLVPGLYLVQLATADRVQTLKLVKE